MNKRYYIIYNPLTYNLMDIHGKIDNSMEVVSYLTELDYRTISYDNYLNFLKFNLDKERKGMVETLAIESYALSYIANQISKIDKISRIILADGKRRTLDDVIKNEGQKPIAVFITSMSSNFPAAVAATIPLNHARIPVIIGGIHVSTSPNDIDIFLRKYTPHPNIVSQVIGPGDSTVISEILKDLSNCRLKPTYHGYVTIEDGVWDSCNVEYMDPMRLELMERIPIIGKYLVKKVKINGISPYLGCPYSCSFCSISTLPKKQRKFTTRSPEDFVNELKYYQKNGITSHNRFYFFLPDNLLLGGKILENILDKIIESDLKINYVAQISIDIADNENLLKKLRLSGATHFFIGLESLNIHNLEFIGKHIVKNIKKSNLSVKEYYRKQIRKIQDYGISIHASFIIGLPFDYFNSLQDQTGSEIERFCIANHVGLQPCPLTDLPGSRNFMESQNNETYLYGKKGSMDYFIALCVADVTEINRIPPKVLHNSPLLVFYMAYQATQRAGNTKNALFNAFYMLAKAFANPTKNGIISLKERVTDSLWAFVAQLAVSQYKDHAELIAYSRNNVTGAVERLYNRETNPLVKNVLHKFIEQFL
jgi:radical SAM superfamily enzyme YgiQ (UPF0313 family)